MPHFMLSWQQAAIAAACLAGAAAVIRLWRLTGRWALWGGVVREAALLLGLYALWQFAATFTVMSAASAVARARWLWHAERVLRLPSEAGVQRPFLAHPLLVQAFNLYYDILHFPVLIGCLVWLFVRHRDRYPQIRTMTALFTGASLLIQLIPVAPPRLLPGAGMTDTAAAYGQSVYAWRGLHVDQFSAMPSVHVGWALIVAIAAIGASRSRWRWLAAAYPLLTTLAVVVTANHFWLDAIAAGLLVALTVAAQRAARRLRSGKSLQAAQAGSVPGEISVRS